MKSIRKKDPQHKRVVWYNKQNQIHREDGPAIEHPDGRKYWIINGEYHRGDGPAIEWPDGTKYWYYHGKNIICKSQEEFERIIKLMILW